MVRHLLTTTDNPYDPFTQFDEWYAHDTRAGHHTLAFLARITRTSNELSEVDNALAIEAAIVEIAQENVSGVHRMIEVPDSEKI